MGHSDFLLFIPFQAPELRHVLKYYSCTVKVNYEGDTVIADDIIENMGMRQMFLSIFCWPIATIISRLKQPKHHFLHKPSESDIFPSSTTNSPIVASQASKPSENKSEPSHSYQPESHNTICYRLKLVLIGYLPEPGYFVAGAAAGMVSRTATAPLDRLKVYLIANTGVAKGALEAASSGAITEAAKMPVHTLVSAVKELWRAGGIRSLFAGTKLLIILFVDGFAYLSGNGLNVVKIMPETAIKFGSYEVSEKLLICEWKLIGIGCKATLCQY